MSVLHVVSSDACAYNSEIDMTNELEQRKRSQAKSKFTRNYNVLDKLISENAPLELVKPQFEKFKNCWESLELAHDTYLELSGVDDVDENNGSKGYLDEPGERHSAILLSYSTYLKGEAIKENEASAKKVENEKLLEIERSQREAKELKEAEDTKKKEELVNKLKSLKLEVTEDIDTFVRVTPKLKDVMKEASERDIEISGRKLRSNSKT